MAPKLLDLVKLTGTLVPPLAPLGAIAGGIEMLSGQKDPTKKPNPLSSTPKYMSGGYITHKADSMFQVTAPGGTDKLKMNYKGSNIRLDNNEVVDSSNNFVFSEGLGYAEQASKLATRLGRAEKRVGDQISSNTVGAIKAQIADLALQQESEKLAKGGKVNAYKNGGPIDIKRFQELYNQYISQYSPTTSPLVADNSYGPLTKAAFSSDLGRNAIASSNLSQANQDPTSPEAFNISDLQDIDALTALDNPPTESFNRAPLDAASITGSENSALSFNGSSSKPKPQAGLYKSGFSAGDALQLAPLIGAFASLGKGSQKDKGYYDTSTITRNTYDPTRQLARNTQSYQTAINSLSGPATATRATANSLLATRLNQDSNVMAQYDQMNQQARTQYEQRVQDQLRNNNRVSTLTDDLNSRNRAAYDARLQYGLRGVGNLGKALNEKNMINQQMNLYRNEYQNVYDNIVKLLG